MASARRWLEPSEQPAVLPDLLAPQLLTSAGRPARIALVHDWFDGYYGSERVVEQILACFPGADLFALVDVMAAEQREFLHGKPVRTSFIQRLPFARRRFRSYLPLMPLAVEQFDLSAYDLVLSSSHAVAKGVLTGAEQPHLAYIHAPMRYAWEYQHDYLRESGLGSGVRGALARYALHRLRLWDVRTTNGVDRLLANSRFIARRIQKIYRRDAVVVHPPVDVHELSLQTRKGGYYLAVSRFVPYKRTELIIEAFRRLAPLPLVVVGDGPGLRRVRARVPANVKLVGYQPREILVRLMQHAKALVFAAQEDFGIVPVEAQACGTPVIAFAGGGALETVRGLDEARPTGLFFEPQTSDAIAEAVEHFEHLGHAISPHDCRSNALACAPERFRAAYLREVTALWREHGGRFAPHTLARFARAALGGN